MNKYFPFSRIVLYGIFLFIPLVFAACAQKPGQEAATGKDSASAEKPGEAATDSAGNVGTPATVTTVSQEPLNDSIELNAVSAFLQKSYVKANANGYLQSADVYPGKYVEAGQLLFTLKTKEAQTIGNSIKILDSSFKFSGVNHINANQHGYITQLNHQSV